MSGKRVFRWRVASGLIAAAGLSVLAAAGASAAIAAPGRTAATTTPAPSWKIVKSVKTGDFTTVVASSSTTGWAFDGSGPGSPAPVAYEHTGGNWSSWAKFTKFPGLKGEAIVAAAATSANNVWAVSQVNAGSSRVFYWDGHTWKVVKTFKNLAGGLAVLGPKDVWVFGDQEAYPTSKNIGAVHYNGSGWSQVPSGKNLAGGSAVSSKDVWAFHGTSVYQWTGSAWHQTSVASLLPAKMQLNDPQVTGILALDEDNVYAIGNGTDEDDGGPTVVLHYNGSKWAKEATGNFGFGSNVSLPEQPVSSDGGSGLWLPQPGADGAKSYIVHYGGSALKAAPLPVSSHAIAVFSVARIPGTAWQVATGYTFNTTTFAQTAVILVYSR
ncbi:MAG: hypothetical protein JWM19_3670 [Actinomycetia bacterium]|nr:hypothetical protein [Actinomycetes bacterium]